MRRVAFQPTTSLRTLLSGLLIALAACGDGDPVAPPGASLGRGVWELATGEEPAASPKAPQVVERLDADRLEALQHLDCRIENNGSELRLKGQRVARLQGIGRGQLDAITDLALTARAPQRTWVTLMAYPGEESTEKRRQLGRQSLAPGEREQLEWSVPIGTHAEGFLELAFHLPDGGTVQVDLESVELSSAPATNFLPPVGSAPTPVTLGTETRPAVTLTQQQPLLLEPDGPSNWRLAAGVPLRRRDQAPPRLVILQEGKRRGELELSVPAGWYEVVLDPAPGPITALLEGADDAACALAEPLQLQAVETPRTVLLITTDTHRADHVGAARGAPVETPAIDALAQRGVFFENASAVSNMTGPSHATLMTGVHPRDTGVVDNASRLTDAAPTLAEFFADAGFLTLGATSASHLGPDNGFTQGFDAFLAPGMDQGEAIDALSWAKAALAKTEGLDVFLWVHLFDPHSPYTPPEDVLTQYWSEERDPRDPELEAPRDLRVPFWVRGVRDPDYLEALYRAEVTGMDRRLERFFEAPRLASGQAIVGLTADHGETLGLGPEAWDHGQLGPDTQAVPLILAAPQLEREAGRRVDLPVGNLDLGRTLLNLAGLREAPFPGRDLIDQALSDAPSSVPRYALSSYGSSATIELAGWYLRLQLEDPQVLAGEGRPSIHHGRGKRRHQVELFHLATDPDGRTDLSQSEPERTRRLRDLLVHFLLEARPDGWNETVEVDEQRSRTLTSLGYAGSSRTTARNIWWDADCECDECAGY